MMDCNDGLLNVYRYCDATVYKRISEKTYINLTDFAISEYWEAAVRHFDSDADCVLAINVLGGRNEYITDITIGELMQLARLTGINTKSIITCFMKNGEGDDIISALCAKRICGYQYGRIVRVGADEFEFKKMSWREGSGKRRVYLPIFRKKFRPHTAKAEMQRLKEAMA